MVFVGLALVGGAAAVRGQSALDGFDPNANGPVHVVVVQPDGKILIGGDFTTVLGVARNYIARLNPDGTLDTAFNPNANGRYSAVYAIAVQADGKILAGGPFGSIGGQTRNGIARLDATTGLADSFDPNAINGFVYTIAVQADGKILAGGDFFAIGGHARNLIARLDATTGMADSFNPNPNGLDIFAIAVQADGKILAGGAFSSIGGQTRNKFARLTNDTAALQNLAVTQTTVTWTLGGSTPQFTRVPFEYSTGNVNYTPLGSGTATGSNWTLTGLNLPTGQNFYIRARGYYSSGNYNGSESITESVRNAFLSGVPMAQSAFSRKVHGGVPFDIPLPLTGNVGVECRTGQTYQMIINFASSVTVGSAMVTSGNGHVTNFSGNGTPQITVNLDSVTDVQRITVTLMNVTDGISTGDAPVSDVPVSMGVLVGDVNGSTLVNSTDVAQTKSQVGQTVTSSNFREDVNASGTITATDVTIVKSDVGHALPP